MKKRLMSLILAIMLIFTILPAPTAAAAAPYLGYRWAGYDNTTNVHTVGKDGLVNSSGLTGFPTAGSPISFYFVDENGKESLVTDDTLLSSTDTDIVTITEDHQTNGVFHIKYEEFGNADIQYSYNGNVYRFPIVVELPTVWFYSSATAAQSTFLKQFVYTSVQDTIYLVAKDGYQFTNYTVSSDLQNISSYSLSTDKTYVTFKITGTPDMNAFYSVVYDLVHPVTGQTISKNNATMNIIDGRPGLKFRWPDWNNGIVENQNNPLVSKLEIAIDSCADLFFYYGAIGNETKLDASKLKSSDTSVITVQKHESNSDAVCVKAVDFGTAKIQYGNDTIDVTVGLPDVGYYSSNTASTSTYLNEFTVTETNDTIYLVANNDWTFTSATLENGFDSIATLTLDSSKKFATIQVTGNPEANRQYSVRCKTVNSNGSQNDFHADISLKNGKPSLRFCWPDDQNGNAHGQFHDFLYTAPGYSTDVWVYLVEGQNETRLALKDLKSSDESVVKVAAAEGTPGMVALKTVGWGTATISYTDANGKTYSFDVVSDLQDFGYYKADSVKKENWLGMDYTVTDADHTLYFIAYNGFVFDASKLKISQTLLDVADVTLSSDGTVVTIDLKEMPDESNHYWIDFTADSPNGHSEGSHSISFIEGICTHKDTELIGAVQPDCTTSGYTGDTVCLFCKEIINKGTPIQKKHDYKNGVCQKCNDTIVTVNKVEPADPSKPVDHVTPIVKQETLNDATKEVAAIVDAVALDQVTNEMKNLVSTGTIEAIKDELAAGNKITTTIVTTTIDEKDVDAATKQELQKVLKKNSEVAQYLDLSIVIQSVSADGTSKDLGTLTELDENIIFTLVVPKDLEKNNRSFYVLRVHNGMVEKLPVTKNKDGSYSFKTDKFSTYALAYQDSVEIDTVFEDISKDDWYYDAVKYVYNNGLMTGLNSTQFGPVENLSRAQFAVILHRMNGVPETEYKDIFPDVPETGVFFTEAVMWANLNGIVSGYADGRFGPADNITREQMVVMMYRYANAMGYDTDIKTEYTDFHDASSVSDFAGEAMKWAVGNGIITGKENGTLLVPQGNANRAECSAIIMRFVQKYE